MGFTKNMNLQLLKTKKKGKNKKNGAGERKMITDQRFASLQSDPRFQKLPQHKSKVSIDSRFDVMFTDKRFSSSSAPLDKRGRVKKRVTENPLRNYYKLDEPPKDEKQKHKDEEEGEESEEDQRFRTLPLESSDSESTAALDSSGSEEEGGSDVDTETDTDEEYGMSVEDEPSLQEEDVPEIEKETRRLAIVNMDWDHVKAVNLYVLLSSCLPKGGEILSVSVYPSEFGLKRMEEEALHGPVALFDDDKQNSDSDDDELDDEKIRAYEKSRLSYYYAVVECDSIATADHLYKSCDGVEYERSGNVLDLRFIPDTMEFKHQARDIATEAPTAYESLNFQTAALQQSKPHISWDVDEPDRERTLKRKFNPDQLAELELKEYLASDESEPDNDDTDDDHEHKDSGEQADKKDRKRDLYRALIESNDGSDEDAEDDKQEMEVTFNTGLEDLSKRILEKKDKRSETVWEAYLRKRSEKKAARKKKSKNSSDDETSDSEEEHAIEEHDDFFVDEPVNKKSKKDGKERSKKRQQEEEKEMEASKAELELLCADDDTTTNNLKGYNLVPKQAKGKKQKRVLDDKKIPNAELDDPRFSALFTSPEYALDPTDPHFKRTAAYARQLAQKKQKGDGKAIEQFELSRQDHLPPDEVDRAKVEQLEPDVSNKAKFELSSLVKSVKMKSKQVRLASDKVIKRNKRNARNSPI